MTTKILLENLATELVRLANCAEEHRAIALENPNAYVDAVKQHFLALLPQVAEAYKTLDAK